MPIGEICNRDDVITEVNDTDFPRALRLEKLIRDF